MSKKKIKQNLNIKRGDVFNKFDFDDFSIFKKKLCGVFIYRGKRSYSIKIYDYLLKELKNNLKNEPMECLFKIIKNIMPFFLIGQKKKGKRLVYLPLIAKVNRKHRFMLNWLVRQLKGRSNIIGIKKEDVLNLMLETYSNKGLAINLKKEFFNQALAYRFNLKRSGLARKTIREWERKKREQERKDRERMFLLTFLKKEEVEKYLKLRKKEYTYFYYFKNFRKKKNNYKKYLVK